MTDLNLSTVPNQPETQIKVKLDYIKQAGHVCFHRALNEVMSVSIVVLVVTKQKKIYRYSEKQ